jgi:hypothetical protein
VGPAASRSVAIASGSVSRAWKRRNLPKVRSLVGGSSLAATSRLKTQLNDLVVAPRRCSPPKTIPRTTIIEVAEQLRDILAAAERGEMVAEPGLVARLQGAALALEALGEVKPPER